MPLRRSRLLNLFWVCADIGDGALVYQNVELQSYFTIRKFSVAEKYICPALVSVCPDLVLPPSIAALAKKEGVLHI